ncbi:biotin/lipoyl-binding protein [Pseudoalteromonas sp. NBT06-2]|nr:biotin/lipoyl-binding protein [Pseudoalteromonas sp. NBT06-2]
MLRKQANQAIFINSAQKDYIKSVHFHDGDIVKAGQLLVQLNNAQKKRKY